MEKLLSNIVGTAVFIDDRPRPLTTVKDVILDPERGKLIAFVVNINKNLVISPVDVLSWGEVIKIHDRDCIVSGKEILRVEEVQKNNIRFINNRVETEGKQYLGKVYDLVIKTSTFDLVKIHVAKSILGLVRFENRIISVKNIIEVLPDKIIVKDGMKTVKEEVKSKVSVEDMAVS